MPHRPEVRRYAPQVRSVFHFCYAFWYSFSNWQRQSHFFCTFCTLQTFFVRVEKDWLIVLRFACKTSLCQFSATPFALSCLNNDIIKSFFLPCWLCKLFSLCEKMGCMLGYAFLHYYSYLVLLEIKFTSSTDKPVPWATCSIEIPIVRNFFAVSMAFWCSPCEIPWEIPSDTPSL